MSKRAGPLPRIFSRSDWPETSRAAELLRRETVGGMLLLAAAILAMLWANSPWRDAYAALHDVHFGPSALGLHLSTAHWASDGLLAVFFFVVGLELAHEFRHGDLRDPAKAAVPVVAAISGVVVPAALYAVTQLLDGGHLRGWAIPTATDIAFALAVLAVIGTHLPSAMRSFLLTLAVVDDLIAIAIIAVFYSHGLHLGLLALAIVPIAGFAVIARSRWHPWWILLPLALVGWALVLNSGIHATIAGVVLGLVVPGTADDTLEGSGSMSERIDHRLRPLSAGVCVPIFAFLSAGVTVVGGGLGAALSDPVTVGVVVGLVLGKAIGVFGGTFATARLTRAQLDDDLSWADVFGLSLLAGVGFTVSLLIGELAFGSGSAIDDHVRLGILLGSVIAAVLAGIVLRRRNRVYRRIAVLESADEDGDGVPDCYQPARKAT
ncbi:Na+/H+ antiporter NhaA [Leekyejoonella antrihumi]|uniref:Na(+)/H(+) antiporter NhaA n=1 Tax=Leekyejoonella antrihumi TaxID=1660198 RepID=A0A563DVM4_9MICO|nr:Na+/H+ antiporter NhaA [Leekyejoonella antrihumi]TWP34318.1 Na+/H+ antiporter NhaA [Leekyejoonella antrihumi]